MNKVILMGRLTRDPEVRYTQTNNTLVASFSIAVNRRFTRPGEEIGGYYYYVVRPVVILKSNIDLILEDGEWKIYI